MASSREGKRSVSLTEALEDYTRHHPESIEELLAWPARRFEHFYFLHQKKQIIAGLEREKIEMKAALWSNSNWDDDKGSRKQAIEDLEENYKEAVSIIEETKRTPQKQDSDEIDKNNPFFAATERGMRKLEKEVGHLIDFSDDEEPEWMKGLDQE